MGKEVLGGWEQWWGVMEADVGYNAPRRPGAFSFTEAAAGSAIQAHPIKIKQDGFIVRHNSLTCCPSSPPLLMLFRHMRHQPLILFLLC